MNPADDTTPFDLKQLIRQVAGKHSLMDLTGIAADVAGLVPEDKLREALQLALPGLVREVVTEHRPHGPMPTPSTSYSGSGGYRPPRVPQTSFRQPIPQPTAGYAGSIGSPTPPARTVTGTGAPSGRLSGLAPGARIREAWQRVLDAPYAVANGEHKTLGDMTWTDLEFVSSQLNRQAEDLQARARWFNALRALLSEREVDTVRELPANDLVQILGAKP